MKTLRFVSHLGMFHELKHPHHRKHTAMRRAVRINAERESARLPPPALGEHTQSVPRESGFAEAEIAEVRSPRAS